MILVLVGCCITFKMRAQDEKFVFSLGVRSNSTSMHIRQPWGSTGSMHIKYDTCLSEY